MKGCEHKWTKPQNQILWLSLVYFTAPQIPFVAKEITINVHCTYMDNQIGLFSISL